MFCYCNGPLKSNSLPKQVSAAIFILREVLWLSASDCNCKLVTKWKGGSLAPRYAHPLLPASLAWDCRGTKTKGNARVVPVDEAFCEGVFGDEWPWWSWKDENTPGLFSYTCYSSKLWVVWLIGRHEKVTAFLSSHCYLCEKRLAFCFISGFGFEWVGFVFISSPSSAVILVLVLVKQSLVLLKERTSEHVTRLFREASLWSSKMGSGCNQKMSKCLLHRSKEESSAEKIALSSKGKAAWQPLINTEVRTDPGFAKYYLVFLFFFFFTPTELLPGFLKIIVKLAWRYMFKISIFLLEHIWL